MPKAQKTLFGLPPSDLEEIWRQLEPERAALRGRRLFLSGGTGFFGKWLLGALADAGTRLALDLDVTVLARDPARFLARYPEAARFTFLHGDVRDFSAPPGRYDLLIHAATDTTAIETPAQEEERSHVIVSGTRRMLEFARVSGAQRLLNISSGAVYGSAAGRPSGAQETDAIKPVTAYGQAKKAAEELCRDSEVETVTARAFAFLGPHLALDAHYAAGNFLRNARSGDPIEVRGDGTALRSYLYPTDLVVWLFHLLLHGRAGEAYNVGSDEVVSTAELARRIADKVEPQPEIIIQSIQPQGVQNIYLPDIGRARTELGLGVRVPLDQAIRRTLLFLEGPEKDGEREAVQ